MPVTEESVTEEPLRFGLVGVDSPHSFQFTELLGDGRTGAVRGAGVTSAWKGVPSADLPISHERIDEFADRVAGLGVPLLPSPEAVAEDSDALLVLACDARTHPALVQRLVGFGKPVYVDTRFALSAAEATAMLRAGREAGTLLLAGSPKRFTPELAAARGRGRVERIELDGPLPTQPGHPTLGWYGFHLVDLAVAALGAGCVLVEAPEDGPVTLTWGDGRIGVLTGGPGWTPRTTGRLHHADGVRDLAIETGPAMLTGLLEAVVTACRTGTPTVSEDEALQTVAIVEAAHRSRTSGRPVEPVPAVTV